MKTIETQIIEKLIKNKQTIAVAESLTGGLVIAKLVNVSGASKVVKGSVTAYTLDIKEKVLSIPLTHTSKTDGVDFETARMMAKNVSVLMDSDYGISTTGIAESWDEREEQAFICIYDRTKNTYFEEHLTYGSKTNNTRDSIRQSVVDTLLTTFLTKI